MVVLPRMPLVDGFEVVNKLDAPQLRHLILEPVGSCESGEADPFGIGSSEFIAIDEVRQVAILCVHDPKRFAIKLDTMLLQVVEEVQAHHGAQSEVPWLVWEHIVGRLQSLDILYEFLERWVLVLVCTIVQYDRVALGQSTVVVLEVLSVFQLMSKGHMSRTLVELL